MGANQLLKNWIGRLAPGAGLALTAVFLTGCMSSGDPDLGLIPQASVGATQTVAQPATDPQTSQHQTAVVMTFDDADPQTVTYANPAATTEPEFMLAVAPTTQPTEALEAVAAVAPEPALNDSTAAAAPVSPVAKTTGRQSRLSRLFSFGKTQPPADIIHLAGGGGEADPARGAATHASRPMVEPHQTDTGSLPGVRLRSLFGIRSANAASQDAPVKVASAGGLARLAPNGLRAQHDSVQMACFKPKLVRLLKKVKRHYGRDVIVTSGYRSTKRNRRAGGARGSRHTTCEAADIQVPGVTKWQLAKYLRTVRGRGGVGTYCHTKSVHIDIGTKRDWNWRCRRR
ncbi:MAG: D-Ala-D-Ala carboxypeptidase family metallohydrolase [Alphaproteobacteria bacterium]|nr:D-Ala-D-Ala carboxypeptidase family metallohydrolase [Alphaproteobacteria bacterium]